MSGTGHGTKAILAAFFANLGIAIATFVGFLITRSGIVAAEARVRTGVATAWLISIEPDLQRSV